MNSLFYSSFLAGSADDLGLGIVVASTGDAWVIGQTASAVSFPTVNPVQPSYGGGTSDAFVARVSSAAGMPDYTVSATPLSVTVTPGGSANYTVTVAPAGGFAGECRLVAHWFASQLVSELQPADRYHRRCHAADLCFQVSRFQTPIAVNGRIIVAADDKLFVFTTQ